MIFGMPLAAEVKLQPRVVVTPYPLKGGLVSIADLKYWKINLRHFSIIISAISADENRVALLLNDPRKINLILTFHPHEIDTLRDAAKLINIDDVF